MKKIFYLLGIICASITLCACGTSKNVEGELTDIMDKLYTGVKDEEKPMALTTTELTAENLEYFAFVNDIDYKEAVVSESMTGSIAHSVVLIRLNDANDAKKVVEEIEKNANPRKWMCVEAEKVYVMSKGDLVVLIMSKNDLSSKIKSNFESLK